MRAEWFREAFEHALIGMALVGLDGHWLTINRAFPALLGYTEAELLAIQFGSVIGREDNGDASAILDRLCDSAEDANTVEIEATHKDGNTLWLLCNVALVRDAIKTPRYYIIQAQDTTARKVIETAQTATRVRLAHSNLALQEFASIAAHDLQEPLRKIQAFGDRLLLKHGEGLGPQGTDYLVRMQDAAARMQRLINGLLELSRISVTARPFEPIDLAVITREVLSDLETRLARTGGHVVVGELPVIEADPTQMRQLLQNLIGNALKFHRPGQPPIVQIRCDIPRPSKTRLADTSEPLPAEAICTLLVADNGIGFDAQYGERIFGVFQRLHGRSEYEGTGIGLAICRTIVERHGGTIVATSVPEQGAIFTVTLPMRQPHPGV